MSEQARPDYRTISRHPSLSIPPIAFAKTGGECSCGDRIEKDDPITLVGSYIEEDEDGHRHVNLSGAEWQCQGPKHSGGIE